MKIIFELHHPKHYYQIKNLLPFLSQYLIIIKSKDILEELLISENVNYINIGKAKKGIVYKLLNSFYLIYAYSRIVNDYKPDLIISKASPYSILLSFIYRFKTVITPDSEVVKLTNLFVAKLADIVITQHCFRLDFGLKHKRIDTFFESCYLHPNYFKEDSLLLAQNGFNKSERIIVIRFIGWDANHDVGHQGITDSKKIQMIQKFEKYGRVVISSEKKLPSALEKYKFTAPPNVLHQVLHLASLYIGDSQSMATEAALLGTPAVRCNSFVGTNDMSNFIELQNTLNMLHNFSDIDEAIEKGIQLLESNSKESWLKKRTAYFDSIEDPNRQLESIITS